MKKSGTIVVFVLFMCFGLCWRFIGPPNMMSVIFVFRAAHWAATMGNINMEIVIRIYILLLV